MRSSTFSLLKTQIQQQQVMRSLMMRMSGGAHDYAVNQINLTYTAGLPVLSSWNFSVCQRHLHADYVQAKMKERRIDVQGFLIIMK